MFKKYAYLLSAAACLTLFGLRTGHTEEADKNPQYDLAESLESAKVTLAKGLEAGQANGKPISGKFEIEGGKIQLSVN
jgi:hypothetical protein